MILGRQEFLKILLERQRLYENDSNEIAEIRTDDTEKEFSKQLTLTFLHGKETELNGIIKIIRKIKTKDW